MPAYYDEKTKKWFCKFYYVDYTGTRKQKKKRGFSLKREAVEWERNFLERQQGTAVHSMSFWTLDQYNSFIQHVEDIRAKTAFQLLFYSGMRFGELLALTLKDCDFQQNTISITKTFHAKKGGGITGPPKTANSTRCISMSAC